MEPWKMWLRSDKMVTFLPPPLPSRKEVKQAQKNHLLPHAPEIMLEVLAGGG